MHLRRHFSPQLHASSAHAWRPREDEVVFTRSARRALENTLPEAVAAAAFEFIVGPLTDDPRRLGKPLREPLAPLYSARRGEYRVLYRIEGERLIVHIVTIEHRRDVYRRR